MKPTENSVYGMQVVPHEDENGILFGGFEGVVITTTTPCSTPIEIVRINSTDGFYHIVDSLTVSISDVVEHSSSGMSKAEYLYYLAQQFAKPGESIAFCHNVSFNFPLLDATWADLQNSLKQYRQAITP